MDSDDWKVLDMGNIVLHIFDQQTREKYDLETLWTVGKYYLCVPINHRNLGLPSEMPFIPLFL